jgi:Ca-activated chloride channel family protein
MKPNDSHDTMPVDDPRLTAYALGELDASEVPAVEALLEQSPEARAEVEAIREVAGVLGTELAAEPAPATGLEAAQHKAIEDALGAPRRGGVILRPFAVPAIAAALLLSVLLWSNYDTMFGPPAEHAESPLAVQVEKREKPSLYDLDLNARSGEDPAVLERLSQLGYLGSDTSRTGGDAGGASGGGGRAVRRQDLEAPAYKRPEPMISEKETLSDERLVVLSELGYGGNDGVDHSHYDEIDGDSAAGAKLGRVTDGAVSLGEEVEFNDVIGLGGGAGASYGKVVHTAGTPGAPSAPATVGAEVTVVEGATPSPSAAPRQLTGRGRRTVMARLKAANTPLPAEAELDAETLSELVALGYISAEDVEEAFEIAADDRSARRRPPLVYQKTWPVPGTEGYEPIVEQGFETPFAAPLSTFSIDVDTASYANVRRFLEDGQMPPVDAVRIEELINYFDYAYPQPDGDVPFAVDLAVTESPWAPEHRLVRVGLKGKEIAVEERAPSNLVFLVDVSGSMNSADKLQLLVASLKMLVGELDERDRVALVTYAGSAGLVLDSTPCTQKSKIVAALDNLRAGGSTHGSQGIQLAYETAARHFIDGGTNRVILATDGDFNVGITDRDALHRLIEDSAKSNVFLSVLLFGTGNIKDNTAELLADKGNGNYSYIDSFNEAQKVLVHEMGGTLITIAKDVKIQVEFNPARVGAYRLIGYENRALAARDFNDDKKDAGEIGAGHTVTAIYEVVPRGVGGVPGIDPLKYQQTPDPLENVELIESDELLTVKLRYKQPEGSVSSLIQVPLTDAGGTLEQAGGEMAFAAAVASYGMLLRHSDLAGDASWDTVLELAERGRGEDKNGYRAEFIQLVQLARGLSGQ